LKRIFDVIVYKLYHLLPLTDYRGMNFISIR